MDSAEQADGEKRVKALLIVPLQRLGLAKPATLTKALFEEMLGELCGKLAYMSDLNLEALAEQIAANPAGKEKDRFPIAPRILKDAADIQQPGEGASPLIRAVFANPLGRDAIAQGWGPELLGELRRNRKWPGAYVVGQIKDRARDNIRMMTDLERTLASGGDLTQQQSEWRNMRLVKHRKCEEIAKMGGVSA